MGIAVMLAGCGETYRPVVTPVAVTGPAPQPQSYTVVTTTAGTTSPGLANIFDASGDTLLTQALLGNGPLALSLSSSRHLCHHRQYRRHRQHLHAFDHPGDQKHPEQHLAAACSA